MAVEVTGLLKRMEGMERKLNVKFSLNLGRGWCGDQGVGR